MKETRAHLGGLDGARGIAILVVLVHNLSIFDRHDGIGARLWTVIAESGWVGVQLFFVLSGFLITGILLQDRGSQHWVRSFYVRRLLRIFPLYYLFLFIYFVILPLAFPQIAIPFSRTIWFWLYLCNWSMISYGFLNGLGHTWSLAVEEQFYLLWPWLVGAVRERTLTWICVVIAVGSLAARVTLHQLHFSDAWLYSSTIARADALAIGALASLAMRSPAMKVRLERWRDPVGAASLLALILLMAITHGMNRNNPLVQVYGYSILAIAGAWLVLKGTQPNSLLDNRFLKFFGKYSYGMYVLHVPLKAIAVAYLPLTDPGLGTELAFIGAMIVVTTLGALVTWNLVEKPILSLKDRLAPR